MPFFTAELPIDKKKEAEFKASLYGVQMNPLDNLSEAQVEAFRNIVIEHDKKHVNNNFDISKPPVVPYVFREFPKTLYKHDQCLPSRTQTKRTQLGGEELQFLPPEFKTRMAHNAAEVQSLIEQGWQVEAPVFGEQEEAEPVRVSRKRAS